MLENSMPYIEGNVSDGRVFKPYIICKIAHEQKH